MCLRWGGMDARTQFPALATIVASSLKLPAPATQTRAGWAVQDMADTGSASASPCLSLQAPNYISTQLELSVSFMLRICWRSDATQQDLGECHAMRPSTPAPVGAFSPLFLSPAELLCQPLPIISPGLQPLPACQLNFSLVNNIT